MKKCLFAIIAIWVSGAFIHTQAQCIKPTPMTAQQVLIASGKWQGAYTYNGIRQKTVFTIAANKDNEADCSVSNPPMSGKETVSECFFCSGGELHVRKYIGDVAYMFQGTPENGRFKGMVTVYDAKGKRTKVGDFELEKIN